MIGNDVIDLALAKRESNWKRRGFLQKLFTPNEQNLIENAADSELMVWNLWSRKEAAYKIYNRQTGFRGFIPLRLECVFENQQDGSVCIDGNIYFTHTSIGSDQIHTIAVTQKSIISKIVDVSCVSEIVKRNGLPYFKQLQTPVSKSHHGQFEKIVTLDL